MKSSSIHSITIAVMLSLTSLAKASVVINEVSYVGVNPCQGNRFIELHNTASTTYVLHNDQYDDAGSSYTLPAGSIIRRNDYLLLCQVTSFQFPITGSDTITLRDASNAIVSSTGVFPAYSGNTLYSLQRTSGGSYTYSYPTPGWVNFNGSSSPTRAPTTRAPVSKAPTKSPTRAPTMSPTWAPSTIRINEVSYVGVTPCQNRPFIELYNAGSTTVNISGYVLHNDQYPDAGSSYTLPAGSVIRRESYLLLCQMATFQFPILGYDTITLREGMSNAVVSSTGVFPVYSVFSTNTMYSLQRTGSGNSYSYGYPTPGWVNFGSSRSPTRAPTSKAPVSKAPTKSPTRAPTMSPTWAPSTVRVNEVSYVGVTPCNNNRFVELYNAGTVTVNISGFVLHNDQYPDDGSFYTFPTGSVIRRESYLLLCQTATFQFAITGYDTITLREAMSNAVVSSTGVFPAYAGNTMYSLQRGSSSTSNSYSYGYPTPGWINFGSSRSPTRAPTSKAPVYKAPTRAPTRAPTNAPTKTPTKAPVHPTKSPTKSPVKQPTKSPTKMPTTAPVKAPTKTPTKVPVKAPTKAPMILTDVGGGQIVITEVADKAIAPSCNNSIGYVELFNKGAAPVNGAGLVLQNSAGGMVILSVGTMIAPGQYLVVCLGGLVLSSLDTIVLRDAAGNIIAAVGPLTGMGSIGLTFQFNGTTYTYLPASPGIGAAPSTTRAPTKAPQPSAAAAPVVVTPVASPTVTATAPNSPVRGAAPTKAPVRTPEILRLVIVDGTSGKELALLSRTGTTFVSPRKLESNFLAIRADVASSSSVGAVVFEYDGKSRIDTAAPFVYGDVKTKSFVLASLLSKLPGFRKRYPRGDSIVAGQHAIKATPYASSSNVTTGGNVGAGPTLTVNFVVERRFQLRSQA